MTEVRTLGDAHMAGWKIRMRCERGRMRGIVKIEPCEYKTTLSMETLVATRGRRFPLAWLASRLQCPNCGDFNPEILFDVPGRDLPEFVPQRFHR
jgi:hypothetical protein